MIRRPPRSTLSLHDALPIYAFLRAVLNDESQDFTLDRESPPAHATEPASVTDRKSTRLNSSHGYISYAVFCLKKNQPPLRTQPHQAHVTRRSFCLTYQQCQR